MSSIMYDEPGRPHYKNIVEDARSAGIIDELGADGWDRLGEYLSGEFNDDLDLIEEEVDVEELQYMYYRMPSAEAAAEDLGWSQAETNSWIVVEANDYVIVKGYWVVP